MWTEGWRKTVIKRGFKAVPVGESLDRLIERDNELYDIDGSGTAHRLVRHRFPRWSVPAATAAPGPRRW